VLSEERVNILSATVTTTRDRVAVSRFTFEMADPKHLGHLVAAVRKVDGVFDAYRVDLGSVSERAEPKPRPFERETLVRDMTSSLMSSSFFGWPPPALDLNAPSSPALTTSFTMSRPEVIVPSSV
jgi:hypothetical protein